MGIDLGLSGRYGNRFSFLAKSPKSFLDEVWSWFSKNWPEITDRYEAVDPASGGHSLGIQLHPGAQHAVFTSTSRGSIDLHAKTSTAGPGYHIELCNALIAIADDLAIRWTETETLFDETHYIHSRDPSDVYAATRRWISTVAAHCRTFNEESLSFSMPLGRRFQLKAPLLTPVGPRGIEWIQTAESHPDAASDMFPWWYAGKGAHYWRGRALVRMWMECPWSTPVSDPQSAVMRDIHDSLLRAHQMDRQLEMPWVEWCEIVDYLGLDQDQADLVRRKAATVDREPKIGYRRLPMEVSPWEEGWSVTIPGHFADEHAESSSWIAWDDRRAVRLTSYSLSGAAAEPPPPSVLEEGFTVLDRIEFANVAGHAVLTEEKSEGDPYLNLQAFIPASSHLLLATISFPHDERDWGFKTMAGIRFHEPSAVQQITDPAE